MVPIPLIALAIIHIPALPPAEGRATPLPRPRYTLPFFFLVERRVSISAVPTHLMHPHPTTNPSGLSGVTSSVIVLPSVDLSGCWVVVSRLLAAIYYSPVSIAFFCLSVWCLPTIGLSSQFSAVVFHFSSTDGFSCRVFPFP